MFRSLIRNFISLAGAEVFTKLITFAAFAYLARICGPAGFGHIEWAAAVLMCASLIVDQGFSSYGAREIAKAPEKTPSLVAEIVTARFLLAAIGYTAIVAFALLLVSDRRVVELLLVYGLSLWTLPLMLHWVFQGHDRMNIVALTQVIRQAVFVTVVLLFVRGSGDLLFVGFAELAGVSFAAAFSVWMYKRHFAGRLDLRPILSAKLFREGLPIGISQLFWVIKMFGATFIVGLVATAEDTGYFAGAMRIYIALHTFVWLYYFNMLPSLSRAWEQGSEQLAEMIRRSIWVVAVASLFGGVVWVIAAPIVMTKVYGSNFLPGGGALQWLAGACIAAAFSGHYRYSLIAAGYQGKEMLATAMGSIIVVVLIPVGYFKAGTSGAAAALFAAEIVVLVCTWLIARRTVFSRPGNGFVTNESSLKTLSDATQ